MTPFQGILTGIAISTAAAGLFLLLRGSPEGALAQVSCQVLNQSQLLASFADTVGQGQIKPATMRNFVCSTLTNVTTGPNPTISSLTVAGPIKFPGIATTCSGHIGEIVALNGILSVCTGSGSACSNSLDFSQSCNTPYAASVP